MKKITREESNTRGLIPGRSISIILASAAIIGVVYLLTQGNESVLYLLSNGLPPLLAFAVVVAAMAGLIRNGVSIKNRVSIVWLGYSLGMLLWLLGESTWAVYALWYSIPIPFPSPADGFWLAGYVPLMCAMVIQAWPFGEFFASRKMLALISSVLVMAGLLLLVLVPATYASAIGNSLTGVVVSLAYPLFDVALLVVALPILFLFGRGTFWRPFLFVTVGLILAFLGDILFSWATLNGIYYDGSYLELFFHWSYLAIGYGFYLRFRTGVGPHMLE